HGTATNELITGDITIIRDFIDVRDVVSAYYLLLTKGEKGDTYNVCSGKGWSLKEIIDIISGMLGTKVTIRTDPSLFRPNDNKIIIGSNEKLKIKLKWRAKYTIEQSLNDMIQYWEEQI
ncbi:MAG: GDP-mannose 4,6-dehydratase, partial [Deltaproteobacteria bacterium]|nr:GDP-mannose 4,6-dehydratase [Deltaproteobacteria bacterium]